MLKESYSHPLVSYLYIAPFLKVNSRYAKLVVCLLTRRGCCTSCFTFLLLLGQLFKLCQNGGRVNSASVQFALYGKQVLDVVLLEGECGAGGVADVEEGTDVLPFPRLSHLWKRKECARWNNIRCPICRIARSHLTFAEERTQYTWE